MLENTKRPVNFTYPEEEAMWNADHPAPSQKLMGNSTRDNFLILQKKFEEEFTEFKNFLEGKLLGEDGKAIPAKDYFVLAYKKLFFIDFPEFFEEAVAYLENSYWEDIDWVDRAWIKNTRDLIREYHAICVAEKRKIWPEMAEAK